MKTTITFLFLAMLMFQEAAFAGDRKHYTNEDLEKYQGSAGEIPKETKRDTEEWLAQKPTPKPKREINFEEIQRLQTEIDTSRWEYLEREIRSHNTQQNLQLQGINNRLRRGGF